MPSRKKTKILIMAGGTGGHVFPGIAVAKRLIDKHVEVSWLVRPKSFEQELVEKSNIPVYFMDVEPLRNRSFSQLILAPFKLLYSFFQAFSVLRKLKPDAVLGMGGFVAGPGALAAWFLRIPLLIHEQNAIPSMTNQILARFSTTVMESFEGTFKGDGVIYTGNPVRSNILALQNNKDKIRNIGEFNLLVLGGSLGATKINEVVPQAIALLQQKIQQSNNENNNQNNCKLNIWHQSGRSGEAETKKNYQDAQVNAQVDSFMYDMDKAYAFADLVICRAGATTIAELSLVGLGAIFIPYPNAVDDHQTKNAQYLVKMGAAEIISQAQLTPESLAEKLFGLINDRAKCLTMGRNCQMNGQYHATEKVAEQCILAIGKNKYAQD